MKTANPVDRQAMLSLSLLGAFRVILGDRAISEFRTQKERALLAYLATEADRPLQREVLAELFWPGRAEGVARNSLRQALLGVRRSIGDEHLLVTRHTVQFNTTRAHWLDVAIFDAHLEITRTHIHNELASCPICMGRLQQAIALYRGDFLADLDIEDSLEFQEWVTLNRERLLRQQVEALRRLTLYRRALGDIERALRMAQRWTALVPLQEGAHRQAMALLAMSDRRGEALKQYQTCRRILAEELGIEPGSETVALYQRIRDGETIPLPTSRLVSVSHNLPAQLTPFVGREWELAQIGRLLEMPDCRLLTVVGPGGAGKTRLALRAAEEIYGRDLFPDGVWLIPLEAVPSPELLVTSLAQALGVSVEGRQDPRAQLLEHLQPRTTLLVMDNLEHLISSEGIDLLLEMLREALGVKVLVTSRERLNCQAEFLLDLEGLTYPNLQYPISEMEHRILDIGDYSAVQLFLERAGRVRVGFSASKETISPIIRICQLVEGLPLGIELAAAGVDERSCAQVSQAIQENLDALTVSLHDVPRRQRSIRAVFEHSWRLLPEFQQTVYRRLSVFQGGFIPEAARAVVGMAGNDEGLPLQALVDKSLLRQDAAERYDLHSLLRQYGAEKLAETPHEESEIREQHGRFYLAFLRERKDALQGERQKEVLDEIRLEMGNVRAAWQWAVDQAQVSEIDASMPDLAHFYMLTSLLQEGGTVLGSAADQLLAFAPEDSETRRVAGQLRLKQADFLLRRGRYPELIQVAQAAIELARIIQDAVSEAYGAFYWGGALWRQGEYESARAQLERALSLAQAVRGDTTSGEAQRAAKVEGRCLNMLAAARWSQGRHAEAKTYLERMLPLFTRLGDQISKAAALGNLGILAAAQGDYAEAKTHYEQALHIHQEVGHPQGQSTGFVNLGALCLYLGAYAEAGAHLQQSLDINREIGARQREAGVLAYLGLLSHYLGEDEPAREYSQQALKLAQEVGDRSRQGMAWMILGHVLLELEQMEKAAAAYRKSVALRRELDQSNLAIESLAGLARVALSQGRLEQAQVHVDEILNHLETGTLEGTTEPFHVYLTCYRVLKAIRDPRAQEILVTAHNLLQERAARIGDEELRRSFLENVVAHCEIVREKRSVLACAGRKAHPLESAVQNAEI